MQGSCVAATKRIFTFRVCVLPRRSNSRSWRARSSFGWKLNADVTDFVQEQSVLIRELQSSNFLGASQAITSGLPVVHEEWLTDLNEPAR